MVRFWRDWKNLRVLPYDGDFNAQPNRIAEAIMICEQEMIAVESEKMNKPPDRKGAGNG